MSGKRDKWGAPPKDYEVGYRKPPKPSQFKKGQSGNPRGRPKDRPTLAKLADEVLSELIPVTIDGVQRRMPADKVLMRSIRARALRGDKQATAIALSLLERRPDPKPQSNVMFIKLVKGSE